MANWSDLGPRVASAAVMAGVGAVAVALGNPVFLILVLVVTALMVWEVMGLCDVKPGKLRYILPVIFAAVLFFVTQPAGPMGLAVFLFFAPLILGFALTHGAQRARGAGTALIICVFFVGYGLNFFRMDQGVGFIVWLLLVVIASDVMGYFAGRSLGGPKFWPSISPKKTWSGTAAGWVGAALVGLGFVVFHGSPASLIVLSVLAAFAGQMGDIAESALKRKVGAKDSSNLIPGHGGVLDRFDALSGAVIFVLLAAVVVPVSV